jgi:hypothetical protein
MSIGSIDTQSSIEAFEDISFDASDEFMVDR